MELKLSVTCAAIWELERRFSITAKCLYNAEHDLNQHAKSGPKVFSLNLFAALSNRLAHLRERYDESREELRIAAGQFAYIAEQFPAANDPQFEVRL